MFPSVGRMVVPCNAITGADFQWRIRHHMSQNNSKKTDSKVYKYYQNMAANNILLALVAIFLYVISEWLPLSHRMLWFW